MVPAKMKTARSATKALRVAEEEEAAEPLPLDKLAPEVLNIIAGPLADEDILHRVMLAASPALAR